MRVKVVTDWKNLFASCFQYIQSDFEGWEGYKCRCLTKNWSHCRQNKAQSFCCGLNFNFEEKVCEWNS